MKPLKITEQIEFAGCWIAGGAILSVATKSDINDYDVYPKNKESFDALIHHLVLDNDCFVVNLTDRALTLKSNTVKTKNSERMIIQVMYSEHFFPTAESIFEKFDFTVCMAAFDCDKKEYVFHEKFFEDATSRTIRFNTNTLFPINSLLRIGKYKEKGFYAPKTEMLKIAMAIINKGMPNSWQELEKQIGGAYGNEISIKSEGIEFNYENVIQLLSDMDGAEFVLEDKSAQYSEIEVEILIDCALGKKIKIKRTNETVSVLNDDYSVKIPYFTGYSLLKEYTEEIGDDDEVILFAQSTPNKNATDGSVYFGLIGPFESVKNLVVELHSDQHVPLHYSSSGFYIGKPVIHRIAVKSSDIVSLSVYLSGTKVKRFRVLD